jgi:C_GCAxxG_C_C family probable redox protein
MKAHLERSFNQMSAKEKSATEYALELFRSGYNCAESTLLAIAKTMGIACHDIPKMASGFGAGLGRHGEVCGAVSGAVMAIGFLHGRKENPDAASKEKIYAIVKDFVFTFEEEFKCVRCKDITGCDMLTEEGMQKAKDLNVHGGICSEAVAFATEEACRVLKENEQ